MIPTKTLRERMTAPLPLETGVVRRERYRDLADAEHAVAGLPPTDRVAQIVVDDVMDCRRLRRDVAARGDVAANVEYARQCVRDCILRGEAPIASHLLLTQPGILDDGSPHERAIGIAAGLAWLAGADATVVYTDRGISSGMRKGIDAATVAGVPVEYRSLDGQAA